MSEARMKRTLEVTSVKIRDGKEQASQVQLNHSPSFELFFNQELCLFHLGVLSTAPGRECLAHIRFQ